MNAVCTIASKNYLAQALTLGDSLLQTNPNINFHILLADEKEELDLSSFKYPIIEFKNIGVPFWEDMAFKYDIIEFNTATKPFFMQWLFNKYNYKKLLYIDPDCAVYSELTYVFEALDQNFIAMTPHIIDPQLVDQSAIPETEHLFDGIFNFGFVGIANNEKGHYILDWWGNRLKVFGYADRCESLHVDQKWMDYVPSMFDEGVKIVRHYGYNMSHWNFHERILSKRGDKYYVNETSELVIFHFSGYDPHQPLLLTKLNKQTKFNTTNRKDLKEIHDQYRNDILNNNFDDFVSMQYSYSTFNNGQPISKLNKRIYRKLTLDGVSFNNPFDDSKTFFKLMSTNGLLSAQISLIDINQQNVNHISLKEKLLLKTLQIAKYLLGIDGYAGMLKGLSKYSKYENQLFLLDKNHELFNK